MPDAPDPVERWADEDAARAVADRRLAARALARTALLTGTASTRDLDVSAPESPYLAFVGGLHVATALALLVFFWRDWVRIIRGFISSMQHRRVAGPDERLAWMIIRATIPVGLAGLLLEHTFRTVLGRPAPAAVFLMLNGVLLFGAERLRRRAATAEPVGARAGEPVPVPVSPEGKGSLFASSVAGGPAGTQAAVDLASDRRLAAGSMGGAVLIGTAQILALLPGISHSGATMAAGLLRGLTHEDAARFSFLLATPVILAAGRMPTANHPCRQPSRHQHASSSVSVP